MGSVGWHWVSLGSSYSSLLTGYHHYAIVLYMNKDTFNKLHGINLRKMRIQATLTQIQVAKALKIHQSAYSRIENGNQEMSVYENHVFRNFLLKKRLSHSIKILRKKRLTSQCRL